jgi:3-mercaptopyruvate sulfurtransferase SseA
MPAIFEVKVQNNPIHLADRQDVFTVLGDPAVTLIAVPTAGEFDGCVMLAGAARGGHIPGGRNLPMERLLLPKTDAPAFSFLDAPPDLLAIFRNLGLHGHDRIIVYCHHGAKFFVGAVSLVDAGFDNISLIT